MWLFILTCRRFKETFDNAQWRKIKPFQKKTLNAASVTLHPPEQTIWGDIWQRTKEREKNATIVTMHLPWQAFWGAIQKYTAKKNQDWCNHCDYVSYQAGHLRTQLKIHSGKKPTKCEFVSSQAGNLRIHLKRHSEDETKRCGPWNDLTHENINWKKSNKSRQCSVMWK